VSAKRFLETEHGESKNFFLSADRSWHLLLQETMKNGTQQQYQCGNQRELVWNE
jgi:hypothetical protein